MNSRTDTTRRRAAAAALLAALLLAAPAARAAGDDAAAQDQIDGATKGVAALDVYAAAYDPRPQRSVAVRELTFPLPVLATDGDFLQVHIGGHLVWLDGAQVSVAKPVRYECVRVAQKPSKTAAIQGASGGCR